MKIDFISIFPETFDAYFDESIMKRAIKKRLISVKAHDLRKWASGKRQKVDDRPFGGGPGMVMMVEPFSKAVKSLLKVHGASQTTRRKTRILLMSAAGKRFTHKDAVRLAAYDRIIFLCPRYEGVDARVLDLVDEEVSIGDYVLTGGELPAMVIADAVCRHVPGVLGKAASLAEESHVKEGLAEYPQYTRPEVWNKKKVPKVLLSGDHKKIAAWRALKMKKYKT